MKTRLIILFILATAAAAIAGKISETTVIPGLQSSDRISIGRPGGSTAYTTTAGQLRTFANRSSMNFALHNNYSTATQAKLNTKLTGGGQGVFSSISTIAANGTRSLNVGNTIPYSRTPRHGDIYTNATTMYYVEGVTAKRMGSSGGTTDISGKLDKTTFNTYTSLHKGTSGISSLPQFSNYTGADGSSWIDKGSTPPSLVTRIADKLYAVAMSLKATLTAFLNLSPTAQYFTTAVGELFTVTNNGPVLATSVTATSSNPWHFRIYSTSTGFSNISAGKSKTFKVKFANATTNKKAATITLAASGINPRVFGNYSGRKGVSACTAGTITTENRTGTLSTALGAGAVGQSFTVASSGTLYGYDIKIAAASGAGTLICRIGSSADLATYWEENSVTITTASNTTYQIPMTTHPAVTASGTHYFACILGTATGVSLSQYSSTGGTYAGGSRKVTSGGTGWNINSNRADDDLVFGVSLCN